MINRLILMTMVGILMSAVSHAHVDRNSWHQYLVGARFIVEQDLNFPPGSVKYVISTLPGKVLSESEYIRHQKELLKKSKVGDSYAVMFLKIDIPGGDNNWREGKKTSTDILLSQNVISEIAYSSSDRSLRSNALGIDPNYDSKELSLYLWTGIISVVGDKNTKDFNYEYGNKATIGEVQDLMEGVIRFDTTSIPVHRIGPN